MPEDDNCAVTVNHNQSLFDAPPPPPPVEYPDYIKFFNKDVCTDEEWYIIDEVEQVPNPHNDDDMAEFYQAQQNNKRHWKDVCDSIQSMRCDSFCKVLMHDTQNNEKIETLAQWVGNGDLYVRVQSLEGEDGTILELYYGY